MTQDSSTGSDYEGYMGLVSWFVIAPILTSMDTAATSVQVSVYVNLVEPKVAGFTYVPNFTYAPAPRPHPRDVRKKSPKPLLAIEEKIVPHMMKEAEVRSEKGVISNVANAVHTTAEILKAVPMVGEVAAMVSPIAQGVGLIANSLGLDKPTSVMATEKTRLELTTDITHTSGLDGATRLSSDPTATVANDKFACDAKDYNQFSNYIRLPGLIDINSITDADTIDTVIYKTPVSPMTFLYDPTRKLTYPTPLANYTERYRYWRGGINYLCHVNCPPYMTFHLSVQWIPNEYANVAIVGSDYGNFARMTISITGDTIFTFSIPYLANSPYLTVPTPEQVRAADPDAAPNCFNGQLIFTMTDQIVTSNPSVAQSTVYYSLWCAGTSDYHGSRAQAMWVGYEDPDSLPALQIKAHAGIGDKMLKDYFEVDFPPLVDAKMIVQAKIVNPDTNTSWTDYYHRPTLYFNGTFIIPAGNLKATMQMDMWNALNFSQIAPLRRFLKTFGQKRGSWRVYIFFYRKSNGFDYTYTVQNYTYSTENVVENDHDFNLVSGFHAVSSKQHDVIECEIPFYGIMPSINPFFDNGYREIPSIRVCFYMSRASSSNETIQYSIQAALGDDFSVGNVLPPNPLHYTL